MTKTGYINGDDLLIQIKGKDAGHGTSHTTTYTTETKERNVKPVSTQVMSSAKFSERSVSKLDIQIEVNGMRVWDETGTAYKALLDAWYNCEPVRVSAIERKAQASDEIEPYLVANFIITSLKENAPSKDDASWNVSLQISGAPETWDLTKVTGEALTAGE